MNQNVKLKNDYGHFLSDKRLDDDELQLLKSINRNQRRRWRQERIMPRQVIEIMYGWGIKLSDKPPERGMRIMNLIDNLEGFIDKSAEKLSAIEKKKKDIVQKMEMARFIADSIVKSELMPCLKRQYKEKFVRGKGGKFIPLSFIREHPELFNKDKGNNSE